MLQQKIQFINHNLKIETRKMQPNHSNLGLAQQSMPFGSVSKEQHKSPSQKSNLDDNNDKQFVNKYGGHITSIDGPPNALHLQQREASPSFGGEQIKQRETTEQQSPTDLIEKGPEPMLSSQQNLAQTAQIKNSLYIVAEQSRKDSKGINSDAFKKAKAKKKKPAKDDFSQGTKMVLTVRNPLNNNLFETGARSPTFRQNPFADSSPNQDTQKDPTSKVRKRRMSAHSLKRQEIPKQNLIQEDQDNDDFDLAQSLLTLQINHRYTTKQMPLQKIGSQTPQVANLRQKPTYKNDVHLKGLDGERTNNHRENIARRMQNYAYASYVEDTQLNLEDNPDQQKDDQQSDMDDEDQNIQKSVSLDDQDLEGLSDLGMNSNFSVGAMDARVQNAIQQTINQSMELKDQNQPEPEEYESLGWGQSIWSTDVMRESKKQFIKNYQHLTSGSDVNVPNQNTDGNKPQEPHSEQECSFDVIEKTIQQETQKAAIEQEVFQRNAGLVHRLSQDYQNEMLAMTVQNEQIPVNFTTENQQSQQNQFIQQQLHYGAQQPPQRDHIITSSQAATGGPNVSDEAHVLNAGAQPPGGTNDFMNAAETNQFYNNMGQTGYNEYGTPQEQPQVQQQTPSVHSGGPAAFTGQASVGVNDLGAEYPGDTSSNYTRHPYSQYGPPSQQQVHGNFYPNQNPQHTNNGYSMKHQNQRPHIFINRAINKYMMNPIYKSKNTIQSLQMSRYSVLPWRGSSNQHNINMNSAQIQPMQVPQQNNQQMSNNGNNQNFAPINGQMDYQSSPQGYVLTEQEAFNSQMQQMNNQAPPYQQYLMNHKQDHPYEDQQFQMQLADNGQPGQRYEAENTQDLEQKVALDAKPFYPKNYGEQRFQQQHVHESAKLLAAGNVRNMQNLRPKAPAMVPVPIPIMRRGAAPKHKPHGEAGAQGINLSNQHHQNERQSIFMSQIFARKIELDQRMQETTQNLEQKIIKAVEINDEEDNDEEEEASYSVVDPSENSTERAESTFNKSFKHDNIQVNIKNLRPSQSKNSDAMMIKTTEENKLNYYENKIKRKNERAAIFKKLQEQLTEFKTEMHATQDPSSATIGHNNAASISPKRSGDLFNDPGMNKDNSIDLKNQARLTPFRQDAKQYMDKVLNLMNMINEVDGLTNVAELKNKLEKQKFQVLKARTERDELQTLLKQAQQQIHQFQEKMEKLIEMEKTYQNQLSDNQNLVQSLNQNLQSLNEQNEFSERQMRQQLQQIDQMRQENHDLIMQNQQLQEIQTQQIQSFNQQKDQMAFNQHNQIQQINNQMEQFKQNNYNLQQSLNQLQIENQQLQQQIKHQSENMKNEDDGGQRRKTSGVSQKQLDNNENSLDNDQASQKSEISNDEIPLEEQLQNANKQIKDLQEYIKKRGIEDMKNNKIRQENFQKNEKAHLERHNQSRKQKEEMEREKDRIINRLKDFIKNHNESILIGSIGSSMIGGEERKESHLQSQHEPMIGDASTIDGQSNFMDSFDKHENADIIKAIMTGYTCEKCDEKDRIIQNNENRINDYIQYIKKQSFRNQPKTSEQACQTDKVPEVVQNIDSTVVIANNNSINSASNGNIIDTTLTPLKASNKLLLNNYVRQVKDYVDNIEDQESEGTEKIKSKLNQLAQEQRITLFDEEEEPDPSIITPELIQDIMSMSVDMISDLLLAASSNQGSKCSGGLKGESMNSQKDESKVVEKIVEKVVYQFKTVDFGMTIKDLKDMQNLARVERKACHHIIVEIEKLMYELNSMLGQASSDSPSQEATVKVFTQIMDTYLQLPLRLKPIFDHCKKIETCLMKALKKQDEVLTKSQKEVQQSNEEQSEMISLKD